MLKLILWGIANPLEFGALFASAIAVVRGIYALLTRLVAPYPRLRAFVEGFAALGPDVLRFVLQLVRAITGRSLPSPDLDARDGELAALRAELLRLKALPSSAPESIVPPAPGGFNPSARQTIAPDVAASIHHATTLAGRDDGQRGSASVRALLAAVVGLAVVLPLGVALMGCPASRQLTRPALGPVDGCEPRSTRCAPDGRPQVCSGSRRWTDADAVCALGVNVAAVCCLTRSPVTGAELHACVLAERCIASDGGL